MAVHKSTAEQRLLQVCAQPKHAALSLVNPMRHAPARSPPSQAAADTWLQMARGADLVLMTDGDDGREPKAIAPCTHGAVAVHVYRCRDCRAQRCSSGIASSSADSSSSAARGCAGVREGWLARRKVLHLFVAMGRRFGALTGGDGDGDEGGSSAIASTTGAVAKRFFLKIDPDTVPVPHNTMRLLVELDAVLGPRQPSLFGMAACRVGTSPTPRPRPRPATASSPSVLTCSCRRAIGLSQPPFRCATRLVALAMASHTPLWSR